MVQRTPESLHPELPIINIFHVCFLLPSLYTHICNIFFLNHLRVLQTSHFFTPEVLFWSLRISWEMKLLDFSGSFIFSLLTALLRCNFHTVPFILDCIFVPSSHWQLLVQCYTWLSEWFLLELIKLPYEISWQVYYTYRGCFLQKTFGLIMTHSTTPNRCFKKKLHFCPILWL